MVEKIENRERRSMPYIEPEMLDTEMQIEWQI